MDTLLRSIPIVLLLVLVGSVSSPATVVTGDDPNRPVEALAAPGSFTTDVELVAWGVELYRVAGLDLPGGLDVRFHESVDSCQGNLALCDVTGTVRIDICWAHENPGVERRVREQALVHELAHVWMRLNLNDAERAAYLDHVGLDEWRGDEVPWAQRGCEHAAELLTRQLYGPPVSFVDFGGQTDDYWAEAFAILTG